MREDVAIDILAANASLMDRIYSSAPDAAQPGASRNARSELEQRITSMESLTMMFAGAKGAKDEKGA